jgi:multisubunit Na+/H+ antiporter MnhB subunit
MNNQENHKKDLLGRYISPEKSEKAPDGFTSKIMTRIQLESLPLNTADRWWKRNPVPLISVAVTILLMVAAYLIPANQADIFDSSFLNSLRNIKLSLPEINLSSIFRLSLPSLLIYVIVGIFVLTLFDRALYGIFKKE